MDALRTIYSYNKTKEYIRRMKNKLENSKAMIKQ
uniref:Uncharacterized protein n=1 Tax=Arundo donax TaxID=35708 RepID=A0A0A8ZSL1_ARUDO